MSIPDRYEIGLSNRMVRGVIFGVEYLILLNATVVKMLPKRRQSAAEALFSRGSE